MFKKLATATLIAFSAITLSACSQPSATETITVQEKTYVTAEGVLTAAVILSTGDIDSAVAEGIVTPSEVDEAQKAIQNNTLDDWKELAKKE